jgi:hypothetical protein
MKFDIGSMNQLFERKNLSQLILIILFLIYLVIGYKMPYDLAVLLDNVWGKIIIIIIAIVLFAVCNPILGILGFFVAYKLIMSSNIDSGNYGIKHYIPREEKKYADMINNNKYPYTLEQEIVKLRAPIYHYNSDNHTYSFTSTLDDQKNAASVNYNGVI